MLRSLLLLMLLLAAVAARHVNSFAGPYLFVFGRIYDCELGEHGFDGTVTRHMRYSRFNPLRPYDQQVVYGNVTRRTALDNTSWARMNMAIWTNNHWQDNALIMEVKANACTAMFNNMPKFFKASGGLMNGTSCTLRAGTFEYHGVTRDRTLRQVPEMPYGRYRSLTLNGLAGRVTTCFYTEKDVIPNAAD